MQKNPDPEKISNSKNSGKIQIHVKNSDPEKFLIRKKKKSKKYGSVKIPDSRKKNQWKYQIPKIQEKLANQKSLQIFSKFYKKLRGNSQIAKNPDP